MLDAKIATYTFFVSGWANRLALPRKQNKLTKYIETQKAKFNQLDLHDVEMREKNKHTKSKSKKGQKQLEKDKEKVGLVDEWTNPTGLSCHWCPCVRRGRSMSYLAFSQFCEGPDVEIPIYRLRGLIVDNFETNSHK